MRAYNEHNFTITKYSKLPLLGSSADLIKSALNAGKRYNRIPTITLTSEKSRNQREKQDLCVQYSKRV